MLAVKCCAISGCGLPLHPKSDFCKYHTEATVREIFKAPPGQVFITCDYESMEMRAWAQVCLWILGYSDLAEILNNPKRCPHVEMGGRLTKRVQEGTTWDVIYALAYALKKQDVKAFKDMRNMAKGPNFGLFGGMRALKLADYCRLNYGVTLTTDEAQLAVDTWESMYREARPYLNWVKEKFPRVPFGTPNFIEVEFFVSKFVRGHVGYTDASNGYVQSLAAYTAKTAGWRACREAYDYTRGSVLYGCRPSVFIHDEWGYLMPIKDFKYHYAGYRLAEIMRSTAEEISPDIIYPVSPAAMFSWSKAAGDPCIDEKGMLVPYEIFHNLPVPKEQLPYVKQMWPNYSPKAA